MTAQGRERELKFSIPSRRDFLLLRDAPEWGERRIERQVNHYFDTADRVLASSRALLRIREGAACILTLKCGREERPGFFDSLELEAAVSRETLDGALADPGSILDLDLEPVAELLARFGRLPLGVLGRLENERATRVIASGPQARDAGTGGIVLEVDRVTFPDGTEEYELEIEVRAESREAAEAWVARAIEGRGIRLEPQRLTKLERLLEWRRKGERPQAQG